MNLILMTMMRVHYPHAHVMQITHGATGAIDCSCGFSLRVPDGEAGAAVAKHRERLKVTSHAKR